MPFSEIQEGEPAHAQALSTLPDYVSSRHAGLIFPGAGAQLYRHILGVHTGVAILDPQGRGGDCTAQLPEGFEAAQAQPVDLCGRPAGAPIPVEKNVFTTKLEAFAPASFRLEPSQP